MFPNGVGNVESHTNIINRRLMPVQIKANVIALAGDVVGEPRSRWWWLISKR